MIKNSKIMAIAITLCIVSIFNCCAINYCYAWYDFTAVNIVAEKLKATVKKNKVKSSMSFEIVNGISKYPGEGRPTLYTEFDANGNKTEEIYFERDQTVKMKIEYVYDSRENMIGITSFMTEGARREHIAIKYNDKNKKIEESSKNPRTLEMTGKVYTYDAGGNLLDISNTESGKTYKVDTYKYDDKGRKIEFIQYLTSEKGKIDRIFSYKYDEKGNMIEETIKESDGKLDGVEIYKYDDKGRAVEKLHKGSYYLKSTMKYDEKGNATDQTSFDEKGNQTGRITCSYDPAGNLFDYSTFMSGKLSARLAVKYDERGLPVEFAQHGEKAEPDSIIMVKYSTEKMKLPSPFVQSSVSVKSAGYYCGLGESSFQKGDFDEAISNFDKAIEIDPASSMAYCNRGSAYSRKGDFDKAINDYSATIKLDPGFTMACYNLAITYSKKGDYENAITEFDKIIVKEPEFSNAYANRGVAYYKKGDHGKALADYKKAIKLDPKNTFAKDKLKELQEKKMPSSQKQNK